MLHGESLRILIGFWQFQSYGEGFPFFNTLKVSIYTKYFTLPKKMKRFANEFSAYLFCYIYMN